MHINRKILVLNVLTVIGNFYSFLWDSSVVSEDVYGGRKSPSRAIGKFHLAIEIEYRKSSNR